MAGLPAGVSAVGIPWYKRSDYKRVLEIMDDREMLPETFDKWQSQAEAIEAKLRSTGNTVVRAHLNPDDFVAWCAADGLDVDARARSAWGAEAAKRHIADTQH